MALVDAGGIGPLVVLLGVGAHATHARAGNGSNTRHAVYYQDAESIRARVAIAQQHGMRGVGGFPLQLSTAKSLGSLFAPPKAADSKRVERTQSNSGQAEAHAGNSKAPRAHLRRQRRAAA